MRRWALVVALVGIVVSALAVAQGPGRGFCGPFGGPPGGGLPALLGIPEVQRELAVTDKQQQELETLFEKERAQMEGLFQEFDPRSLQSAPREEAQARMERFRVESETIQQATAVQILKILDSTQMQRLRQLRLQREGVQVFAQPEVAEKLKLTDEQQNKLAALQADGGFGFGPHPPSPETLTKALALLTADQKTAWQELTGKEFRFPEGFGPGLFGGRGGPGGPPGRGPGGPGFGGQERALLKEFDQDKDGMLNAAERKAARQAALADERSGGPGPGGRRGPGGFGPGGPGGNREAGKPGPKVSPEDVTPIVDADLYAPNVLRTIFIEFENADWEEELEAFHNTDVEVPATVTVDGKQYPKVGVHFRGMSSYGMVPRGSKRSLNLAFDEFESKQNLYGYKSLNLLNANGDPSFLSSVLYSHIARNYIPAPKANLVRVVINGESWGVYANVQQFDKVFLKENFQSKGTRWKVPGSPGGNAGLDYIGDNIADYKRRYEMKSDDGDEAWQALIKLCKMLKETPAEKLPATIEPILDVDGALWFLALDNGLINSDGYWTRASDYSIFLDEKGKFHVVPHDMNEAFHGTGGPGGFGGPPGGGFGFGPPRGGAGRPGEGRPDDRRPGDRGERQPNTGGNRFALDPLVGLNDSTKPLRSKLLAVPKYREQYLCNVRTLAEQWLDWNQLGPVVDSYADVIAKEVPHDTRKLSTTEAFLEAVGDAPAKSGRTISYWEFAKERREYLLKLPELSSISTDE